MADRIRSAAESVSGVVAVERVRVRAVGPVSFVDLVVAVSRTLPLDRVAEIKAAATQAIKTAMPEAEVAVATEPRALS